MDTIYALVIILSGTVVPHSDAGPEVLSGEVENKTTVYFTTLEACQKARDTAIASKDSMVPSGMDVQVQIKDCEGIQVTE